MEIIIMLVPTKISKENYFDYEAQILTFLLATSAFICEAIEKEDYRSAKNYSKIHESKLNQFLCFHSSSRDAINNGVDMDSKEISMQYKTIMHENTVDSSYVI